MNQEASDTTASPSIDGGVNDVDARIAAIVAGSDEDAPVVEEEPSKPETPKAKAAKEAPAEAEEPASTARDRIRAIREEQQRKQEAAQLRKRAEVAERLEAENAELRQKAAFADTVRARITDKSEFFKLAKDAGVTPQELASWLQSAEDDPIGAMTAQARKAIDPELAALKAENAEIKRYIAEQRAEREAAAAAQNDAAAAQEFVSIVDSRPDSVLARFAAKYGNEKLIGLADAAARSGEVAPGPGALAALADLLEDRLSELSGIGATVSTKPQIRAPRTPSQATRNINSRLTSERTSVSTVENDLDNMSVEDRIRYAASLM